jgi:hypothetical protein
MSDIEDFIRSQLGETATPFEYQVNRATRTGWKRCDVVEPGNYDSPDKEFAETHWRASREKDIRLFSGKRVYRVGPDTYADFWGEVEWDPREGPPPPSPDPSSFPPTCTQLFAMPGLEVLEIIEFCKVGTHNAGPRRGPEPWRIVECGMAEVMKIAPFEIQFADEAGLSATFLQRISTQQAVEIGNIIVGVNCEAMELPVNELLSRGMLVPMDPRDDDLPDYEAAMTEYLTEIGKFRLWWD